MVDNYDLWVAHDNDMQREIEKLPLCECCGEPIQQDTAVRINGD